MKSEYRLYNKDVYPYTLLLTAKHDYRNIAAIVLLEEEMHYRCIFQQCVTDPARVANEFDNYLIELINSKGMNVEL